MILSPYLFPNEPSRFDEDDFHRLLVHTAKTGASDIKIQTNNVIWLKIQGKNHRITHRPLTPQEVEGILRTIYGIAGPNVIKDGRDIDRGYEIHPTRLDRYRFRMNIVGGVIDGQPAIEITGRTIKLAPPTMDENNVEEGIMKGCFPKDGIVLVVGPTGSGKSTLIASMLGHIVVQEDSHKIICTFEAPIEYVYDSLPKPSSLIFQTEIGPEGNLKTFYDAIRNAMRRAPDIIFTGESRDLETVEATLAAAQSGHAVYSTVHANSVVETFSRTVNLFPEGARSGALNALVSASRMVIWQRLFVKPDGSGRVAVREFLQFTEDIRQELLTIGSNNTSAMMLRMGELVHEQGQSKSTCATRFYEAGLLSKSDWLELSARTY